MIDFSKYLFITVCSHTKNKESFKHAMPLNEMYIGQSFCSRLKLLKTLTDEIYISSLLGPGIVLDNYIDKGYDAPPPPILKKYEKDPNFSLERRKMFNERYPGRLDSVETVFFLGDSNYDNVIKKIFSDKKVVIIIDKKISVARLSSYNTKVYEYINNIKFTPKDIKWCDNGDYILSIETGLNSDGIKKSNIMRYKKINDKQIRFDFNYSISDWARNMFKLNHEDLKKKMHADLNLSYKTLGNITVSMVFNLLKKNGINIHTENIPYEILPYNPLDEDIFHPDFKALLTEFITEE